jgi:predicted amidophosphoribosyltransferase
MSSNALVPCPDCERSVSRLVEACPNCGRPLRDPKPREGLFLRTMNQAVAAAFLIPVFLLLILVGTGLVAYFFGYFTPSR